MKIDINNVKKFAAMGLVLVNITSLAGCKTDLGKVITYEKPKTSISQGIDNKGNNQKKDEEIFVSKSELEKEENIVIATTKKSLEEVALAVLRGEYGNYPERKQKLEAEGYNYEEVQKIVTKMVKELQETEQSSKVEDKKSLLETFDENPIISENLNKDIQTYYSEHIEEINDVLNPEYHDIHVKYGSLIYQRLVNAGIPKEIILGELANVILEQQLPRCCSEEEWQTNFGTICSVLGEYESMYEAYFCLSYLVHDELCELEHRHNEFGAITCEDLQTSFQKKYNVK